MNDKIDQSNATPTVEQSKAERQARAFSISKNAIQELNLTQYDRASRTVFTQQEYEIFYQENDDDLSLTIEYNPIFTTGLVHINLVQITNSIIIEFEFLLSALEARQRLQVEESEIDATINDKTLILTKDFILHFPRVIAHGFHQGMRESIINHVKKFVDYDLRENTISSAKAKNASLLPDGTLDNLIKLFPADHYGLCKYIESKHHELSVYRNGVFGDRKAWLTPAESLTLPKRYEELRIIYKECKREYLELRTAFFRLNKGADSPKWDEHWKGVSEREYPNLFFANEVVAESASRLAYRQLAEIFGFDDEYMEKLVRNAKGQLQYHAKLKSEKGDNSN